MARSQHISAGTELFRWQGYPVTTRDESEAGTPVRSSLVLVVMCAGMFLVLLDITVVNVALPAIQTSLHTGITAAQLVVDGYAVAIAGLLLTGGALGDRIGHRTMVLFGLGLFAAGSTGCGLAWSVAPLVAGRILQGVGAALFLPASIAVIVRAYPERRSQARALGVWAGVSALALPAGPLLGGRLVSTAVWRWVFLINPPVILAAAVGILAWVPGQRGAGLAHLDLVGTITSAVMPAALIGAVIAAGHRQSALAVSASGLALAAAAGFWAQERRTPQPLVPFSVFRQPA